MAAGWLARTSASTSGVRSATSLPVDPRDDGEDLEPRRAERLVQAGEREPVQGLADEAERAIRLGGRISRRYRSMSASFRRTWPHGRSSVPSEWPPLIAKNGL